MGNPSVSGVHALVVPFQRYRPPTSVRAYPRPFVTGLNTMPLTKPPPPMATLLQVYVAPLLDDVELDDVDPVLLELDEELDEDLPLLDDATLPEDELVLAAPPEPPAPELVAPPPRASQSGRAHSARGARRACGAA